MPADDTPPIHATIRIEEKDNPMMITPNKSVTLWNVLKSVVNMITANMLIA